MAEKETTILAEGFYFLEGPRWRDDLLWMSEYGGSEVITLSADGRRSTVVEVPGLPSGLGFLPDGTPIVVSIHERKLFRIEGRKLALHADLTTISRSMINDMVVDRRGRAYVGDSGFNLFVREQPRPGQIILVEPDGRAQIVADDLNFPNGMAITADNRLIVAETFRNRLTSFDIEPDGTLHNRKIEAEVGGTTDGICLDADGGLWVGMVDQGFARVKDGRIVDRVPTGERKGVACQLGGADGRTLFCLTFLGDVEDIGKIRSGRVETVRVDAPAAGSP